MMQQQLSAPVSNGPGGISFIGNRPSAIGYPLAGIGYFFAHPKVSRCSFLQSLSKHDSWVVANLGGAVGGGVTLAGCCADLANGALPDHLRLLPLHHPVRHLLGPAVRAPS